MSYLAEMELCRQFLKERNRPRNYARHGLQKKMPADSPDTKTLFTGKPSGKNAVGV